MKEKGTIELCRQGQLLTGLFRFPHAGDDNLIGNNNQGASDSNTKDMITMM